jgi:polyisoprenoid-binding protein YceI
MSLNARIALAGAILGCTAPAAAQSAGADSVVYHLTPDTRFEVKTGKAGLFGFAGHEHLIRANSPVGEVVFFPDSPAKSRVRVTVLTDSLEVLSPPDTEEIRKVTHAMRTEVLHPDQYSEITFESKEVTPIERGYRVRGALTMEGQTRELTVNLTTAISPDTLQAEGSFAVNQTDFGIKPFRGGPGGTVRVADRVTFHLKAVGVLGNRQ